MSGSTSFMYYTDFTGIGIGLLLSVCQDREKALGLLVIEADRTICEFNQTI